MQDISSWLADWDDVYGWDLEQIGTTLFVSPDVSHWSVVNNSSPQIDEVKFAKQIVDKEVKAIIYKGTDARRDTGELFMDATVPFWWELGGRHGLLRGMYHWLQYSVDPTVAFNYHKSIEAMYPTELPYFLDFEEPSVTNASDYLWRAKIWLGLASNDNKGTPVVYTGEWYLDKIKQLLYPYTSAVLENKMGWLRNYPCWLAWYSKFYPSMYLDNELWPWGDDDWVIWQYSSTADFPHHADGDNLNGLEWGIQSKGMDMNLIKLSWLESYADVELPDPEPEPDPDPVDCAWKYKTRYNMNVRVGPGTKYEKTGSYPAGFIIEALDTGGTNSWIETSEGWVCYMLDGEQYLDREVE